MGNLLSAKKKSSKVLINKNGTLKNMNLAYQKQALSPIKENIMTVNIRELIFRLSIA